MKRTDAERIAAAVAVCEAGITEVEGDPRFGYPPARVDVNAPLALIQVDLKARRLAYRAVLAELADPEPLPASAPDPLPRATFEPDPRTGTTTTPRDPFTADTGPRVNALDDEDLDP